MPSSSIKTFVIWEPIIFSDISLPPNDSLARVSDHRARQYYDEHHFVSKELQRQIVAAGGTGQDYFFKGQYVWDTMAVYPPGALWDDSGAKPAFVGAPVNDAVRSLAQVLREIPRATIYRIPPA